MSSDDAPLWLFADQLGTHVHGGAHAHREVVLVESAQAMRRHRFHRQKLHLVLSALRHAATDLGDRATYLRTATYTEALRRVGRPVVVHEPTSHAAETFVHRLRRQGLVAEILPTPTFALSRTEFAQWAGDRTRFRMEDFYRAQRRRFDVLMDGAAPVGGRWNLDADNREPPPKGRATLDVPAPYQPREDEIDEQVRRDLDRMDLDTVGVDGPRRFAVTPDEARRALRRFVTHRLPHFGSHKDAIMGADWSMAHSLLAYIDRMSDHCAGCAYDPRRRVGERACPFTAGYWAFVHRNADLLARNQRTARAVSSIHPLPDLDVVVEQESRRDTF